MTDFDYRKYSLEQLENWIHDSMSCGESTPKEIYDVIVGAVKDNYYTYKHQASQAYELLSLLNNNPFAEEVKELGELWDKEDVNAILNEREYYDGWDSQEKVLTCDKDDPSPECKSAWDDFWKENYYPEEHKKSTKPKVEDIMPPWGHSDMEAMRYTEAELNAMCDKAASDEEKEKCREYNLREAEYYNKRAELDAKKDKVTKWVLPVQVDGLTGDCFVNFPDDLLEQAGLKEGDTVEWITRDDGIIEMRKVTKPPQMDEC